MSGKKNKKRYQVREKPKTYITCTGRIYLQYRDEEAIEQAQKGDLLFFPSVESLHTIRQGDYESTGYAGYFRVDVCDGKAWQPVLLSTLFPGREHYFAKKERPLDTFEHCAELLRQRGEIMLYRTYREHYAVEGSEEEVEE